MFAIASLCITAWVFGIRPANASNFEVDGLSVIEIPAGVFIAGSNRTERDHAYKLDERAYGHDNTRKWK